MSHDGWDVFLSYARHDVAAAAELAALLRGRGLSVFVDEAGTSGFSSLDGQLRAALAASKVLVAFYSATYPLRPSCQFELTAAFTAGQRDGDPRGRIAVVNPEEGPAHIVPVALRDVRHSLWPFDSAESEQFPEVVARRVAALASPIGTVPDQVPGFVGRYPQLWRLHAELTRTSLPLASVSGPKTCLVTGLPGIGKTALARQYAALFGSAFADGVVWGRLDEPGGSAAGLTILDLPPGVSRQEVANWLRERPAGAASLVLSEDRLDLPCEVVSLSGLGEAAALDVLTGARGLLSSAESQRARELVDELGGHPQAVLSAAAMMRAATVADPVTRVRAAWLSGEASTNARLSDGYPADPLPSLRRKLSGLGSQELDMVRALSILPPRFCRPSTLAALWTKIGGVEPATAVLESVARRNLCGHLADGAWRLHPLLRLLAPRLEADPVRRAQVEQAAWLSVSDYSGSADPVAGGAMTASTLSQAEQQAAFRLQVDLSSRITTVPLADEDGFLREALTSMKVVLQTARESLTSLAVTRRSAEVVSLVREVIDEIRPLLSRWHPLLAEHESLRPSDVGVRTHERNWVYNAELRRELAELQERLRGVETRLEDLTGTQLSS